MSSPTQAIDVRSKNSTKMFDPSRACNFTNGATPSKCIKRTMDDYANNKNGHNNGATNNKNSNSTVNGNGGSATANNDPSTTTATNGSSFNRAALRTNGHDGNGMSCCQAEETYDSRFQEGLEFLNKIVDIVLNEGIKQGIDVNSKVVEFLSPAAMESILDLGLEDEPVSNDRLIDLCRDVLKYSVKTGHPHFFNQLYGGLDPYGLTGSWLTEAVNTSQYTFEVAPVFTIMEKVLFAEMRRLIGYEDGDGIFCPGGSLSNLYAVNLARFQKFPDVKTKGLRHFPEMCIMTSEKGHYSMKKAAATLGMGMDSVITIKTDRQGRMIPLELDNALMIAKKQGIVPIIVNATAGNTVLGAYDPLVQIADVCQKHDVWMHVDACWGGGVLLSDKLRHKMAGVERADSVAWNPHKMMGAPLQAATFLTKHKNILNECHSANAKYLFQQDKFYDVSYDTGDKAIQCGRKVDVLKVWMMWKAKGTKTLAADIEHLFHCSDYITMKLSQRTGFRLVLEEPECTNVCFWYIPPRMQGQEETKAWRQELGKVAPKIKERMVKKGSILIGYQPDGDNVNFFRLVLVNKAIKTEDMDFVIDEIDRLGCDL